MITSSPTRLHSAQPTHAAISTCCCPQPAMPSTTGHCPLSILTVHAATKEEVEDGDWPLPRPPVAEEDMEPQPPTTTLPTDLVAELTACLKRMGMTPEQLPRILTPEYYETVVSGPVERSHHPPEPPARPHRSPCPSPPLLGPLGLPLPPTDRVCILGPSTHHPRLQ